jgi:hypothetical protein
MALRARMLTRTLAPIVTVAGREDIVGSGRLLVKAVHDPTRVT